MPHARSAGKPKPVAWPRGVVSETNSPIHGHRTSDHHEQARYVLHRLECPAVETEKACCCAFWNHCGMRATMEDGQWRVTSRINKAGNLTLEIEHDGEPHAE